MTVVTTAAIYVVGFRQLLQRFLEPSGLRVRALVGVFFALTELRPCGQQPKSQAPFPRRGQGTPPAGPAVSFGALRAQSSIILEFGALSWPKLGSL